MSRSVEHGTVHQEHEPRKLTIAASRVELAVAKLGTPQQFYAFHRKIYALRGTVDGMRALEVAVSVGLDRKKLAAALEKADLFAPIPHANDQSLADKTILLIDHNAYHLGQLLLLRRLLNIWSDK